MNPERNRWLELPENNQILGVGKLISARMCLLSLVLMVASYCTFFEEPGLKALVEPIYIPISVLFAISIASSLWAKRKETGNVFLLSQTIIDITIISGIVWITGGAISPFLFLYLPVVMMAAILLPRVVALSVAFAAGAAYAVLIWAITNGVIPTADGLPAAEPPASGYALQLLGLFSALILVAIFTQFLKQQLAASRKLAAKSAKDLYDIAHRQKALVSGMPEGVIMTGPGKKIITINKAACALLQIEPELGDGKTIPELLTTIDKDHDIKELKGSGKENAREVRLKPSGDSKVLTLASHRRDIFDENNEVSGSIVIFQDITKLRSVEAQLEMQERMARMLAESGKESGPTYTKINSFVGESPVMQQVFKLIEKVASSDATVLVHGESGTGKELVAKAIHLGSPRANKPFVAVNCGAIPETLIESELFGHKKGSFTGAESDHIGMFRQAHGGTIFLDEIGELPLLMQAKILRVLQEKTVRPVGAEKDFDVDVRIIAATNRNLKQEVAKQAFREDLYYRLNVIGVKLPRLAERREDIPLLVNSLLKKIMGDETKPPMVTPGAMKCLLEYDYPGNVRELENILERAKVLGGEVILPEHLPEAVLKRAETSSQGMPETKIFVDESVELPMQLDDLLSNIERRCLEAALIKTKGAKKRAAEMLGMNFRSFRYRLQKYDIE